MSITTPRPQHALEAGTERGGVGGGGEAMQTDGDFTPEVLASSAVDRDHTCQVTSVLHLHFVPRLRHHNAHESPLKSAQRRYGVCYYLLLPCLLMSS